MTNSAFSQFIKQESLKQFDGDYDILFAEMLTKELKFEDRPLNIRNYLIGSMSNGRTTGSVDEFLENLIQDYPLLQISVPEIFEESTENWDLEGSNILVTYLPEDYDEISTKELVAFDSEGNEYLIDAINEPTEPVVVIGLNERLDLSEPLTDGRINSYFSNKYYSYILRSNEIEPEEFLESNKRKSQVQAYDRDSDDGRDVLYKGRFVDKDAFRQVESWPGGRPEFKVVIGYVDKSSGTPTARTTTKYLSESGWIVKKFFHVELSTKTIDVPIITWFKDRHALDMAYVWLELDAGGSGTTEINTQLVTKFDDNTTTTQTIKTTIDGNDDEAGDAIVQYEHSTSGEGTWYNTGIVRFSVNQE